MRKVDEYSVMTADVAGLDRVTARQRDVLALLSFGYSNKEIAFALEVGESTIKSHVSSLLEALGCSNRTKAALVALCLRRDLSLDEEEIKPLSLEVMRLRMQSLKHRPSRSGARLTVQAQGRSSAETSVET